MVIDPSVLVALGLIAGIAGTLAGPAATVIASSLKNRHDRSAAREDRRQHRLESTYESVSEYILRVRDMVRRTEPVMSFSNDPGPPTFPPEDDLRRIEANVALHGGQAVLDGLEALARETAMFNARVMQLRAERDGPGAQGDRGLATWLQVDEDRKVVFGRVQAIRAQMSRELRVGERE